MIDWPPASDRLKLQNGSVHVWAVALDDADLDCDRGLTILPSDERGRAAKFKFERDRRRYVVAHSALHEILAGYLGTNAADLRFVAGENGKPKLAARFAAGAIEFNLSHSHERALVAVALGREVGVDIEFIKVDFAFDEIAGRFFTAKEVNALRALPAHLQRRAFYKCWTSKEAFLKAKGTGLSGKLDDVEITLAGNELVQITANVPGWSLAELNPGDSYEAAIAIQGERSPVSCYRWRPPATA
jgi:4'-phosphopantetheinyl transferase